MSDALTHLTHFSLERLEMFSRPSIESASGASGAHPTAGEKGRPDPLGDGNRLGWGTRIESATISRVLPPARRA